MSTVKIGEANKTAEVGCVHNCEDAAEVGYVLLAGACLGEAVI